jgi:hypothetical protein
MERVGGFGGKANQLTRITSPPARRITSRRISIDIAAVTPADIKAAVEKYLPKGSPRELSVRPGEKK